MIHWLIQSLDDCPEILRDALAPAWLCASEQQRLVSLKVEKRRRDWLLGRWTAKNLVQRYLATTTGETLGLDEILIGADVEGAPFASCELRGTSGEKSLGGRAPVSLSISHSHGTAFCGLIALNRVDSTQRRRGTEAQGDRGSPLAPRRSLGCDIEFVEPREANFVHNFFTAQEIATVTAAGEAQEVLITAIWSAKEAVLKALREGLRIDTRALTCRFGDQGASPAEWSSFVVALDAELSTRYAGAWSGWWRIHDKFVLTLALYEEAIQSEET